MEKFARRCVKRAVKQDGGVRTRIAADRVGLVPDRTWPDAAPERSPSRLGAADPTTKVSGLAIDCIESVFGRIRHSVLIVDADLRLLWRNAAADRLLATRCVLSLSNERLSPTDRRELAPLQWWIDKVVLGAVDTCRETVMTLGNARTGRFCEIVACRGTTYGWPLHAHDVPVAILFVSDPDRRVSIPPSVLDSLFGLTECERRLVDGLLNGINLDGYAAQANIKVSTARTHLKSVFRKTDTRSQAALVSLLSRLVPPLEVDGRG